MAGNGGGIGRFAARKSSSHSQMLLLPSRCGRADQRRADGEAVTIEVVVSEANEAVAFEVRTHRHVAVVFFNYTVQ